MVSRLASLDEEAKSGLVYTDCTIPFAAREYDKAINPLYVDRLVTEDARVKLKRQVQQTEKCCRTLL